jgi:hypothetical protein
MLSTLRATLSPSGNLSFDDPVRITEPVRVLVTLLDEQRTAIDSTQAAPPEVPVVCVDADAGTEDPARTEAWKELLALRAQAIADGMHLMDWEEIDAELRERRGGARDD